MKISEKIQRLRTENNMTQEELGKIAGASNKAISAWEKGEKTPRLKYVQNICEHFGVDTHLFVDDTNDVYCKRKQFSCSKDDFKELKKIPVLGRIAAGYPIYAEENVEGYTYTDLNGGHEYFGLKVKGDSMDAAATILFDAGVDVKDAQEILGHSSIQVTRDIYTHIRQERREDTANKINLYLEKKACQDNVIEFKAK